MSLTNPEKVVTEERLSEFYQAILPYLGGMPDVLANKFSKADLYSTDEKMIGRWIDGKPLYQKTINTGVLPNKSTKSIAHGISDIDNVVNGFGFFIHNNGNLFYFFNHPYTSYMNIYIDKTNINVVTGTDATAYTNSYVTLQYTKTTDSAIEIGVDTDYSTTEKIVGTWIDGKPVYQKTVYCGALPNNTSKNVAHGISNLGRVVGETACFGNADNQYIFIDYTTGTTSTTHFGHLIVDSTNIQLKTTNDGTAFTGYVTLQYTKTTD